MHAACSGSVGNTMSDARMGKAGGCGKRRGVVQFEGESFLSAPEKDSFIQRGGLDLISVLL